MYSGSMGMAIAYKIECGLGVVVRVVVNGGGSWFPFLQRVVAVCSRSECAAAKNQRV